MKCYTHNNANLIKDTCANIRVNTIEDHCRTHSNKAAWNWLNAINGYLQKRGLANAPIHDNSEIIVSAEEDINVLIKQI